MARFLIALSFVFLINACTQFQDTTWHDGRKITAEMLSSIKPGKTTYAEFIAMAGAPSNDNINSKSGVRTITYIFNEYEGAIKRADFFEGERYYTTKHTRKTYSFEFDDGILQNIEQFSVNIK